MKAKGFDALNMEFGKNEIDTSQLSIARTSIFCFAQWIYDSIDSTYLIVVLFDSTYI